MLRSIFKQIIRWACWDVDLDYALRSAYWDVNLDHVVRSTVVLLYWDQVDQHDAETVVRSEKYLNQMLRSEN